MWGVKIFLWLSAILIVSSTLKRAEAKDSAEARDKDYEDKPYKFGFSIENYLHREEEKDAAGLVHGEFGFVTGDGVYHVTGYATDENGDFKITKMKSYYVGLPGLDGPAVKKDQSGKDLPPMQVNPTESPKPAGIMGCGSCIIPTEKPPNSFAEAPLQSVPAAPVSQSYQDPIQYPQDPNQYPQAPNQYPQDPNQYPQNPSQYPQDPIQYPQDPSQYPQAPNQYPQDPNQYPQDPSQYPTAPNQYPQDPNQNFQSVYPTFQPVLQDTSPTVGTPVANSISSDDMLRLLYRFNYTVGFHGHNEEGDAAGNKKGGYFVNGRDGYGRKFNYIANEFGYQPTITLESLSGEAVPRQETEKSSKYGLKGYEFRWFYRR